MKTYFTFQKSMYISVLKPNFYHYNMDQAEMSITVGYSFCRAKICIKIKYRKDINTVTIL